jgi:hypothetical protein
LEGEQLMFSADPLQKRLHIAGTLLIVGLVIEALCLLSKGPIAFVIFVAIGGCLLPPGWSSIRCRWSSTMGKQLREV